jgi:hypothetical protein
MTDGLGMTEEEKRRFEAMERQIAEIHSAFFKPQIGEKLSMVEKLSALVDVSEKGQWVVSRVVKGILVLGAIAAAFAAIKNGVWTK